MGKENILIEIDRDTQRQRQTDMENGMKRRKRGTETCIKL